MHTFSHQALQFGENKWNALNGMATAPDPREFRTEATRVYTTSLMPGYKSARDKALRSYPYAQEAARRETAALVRAVLLDPHRGNLGVSLKSKAE